jgi:hypothetical protein
MKMSFRLAALIGSLQLCSALRAAPEIGIITLWSTVVPDDATPDAWRLTQFSPLSVGSEQSHTFVVRNFSSQTTLTLFQPTIGGNNPADFSVTSVISSVPPGGGLLMGITFKPIGSGPKSAIVTINNDDSPPEDVYTINVTGTGVSGTASPAPDLAVALVGAPKTKYIKQDNHTRIKAKVEIQNLGDAAMESGVLEIYESHTDHLDALSVQRGTLPLKAIAALEPGKSPKRRKVRINVDTPLNVSGKLFVRVFPLATEADFSDNQVGGPYDATVP